MKQDRFLFGARWRVCLCVQGYAYCRWGVRIGPNGKPLRCLDIADVYLPPERRGHGLFTAFLRTCEARTSAGEGFTAVYVENVFNERLAQFLSEREGYVAARNFPQAPSFFYLPP